MMTEITVLFEPNNAKQIMFLIYHNRPEKLYYGIN